MKTAALVAMAALAAPLARPADTDSVDSVVHAVYAAISGPAGARDWVRFRGVIRRGGAADFDARHRGRTFGAGDVAGRLREARRSEFREKCRSYESELARRVESFGSIAHVFSTYESRRAPGDKPFARGINSFQLVKEGPAWKVMTILWDAERESNPLPEKYLK